MKMIEIDEFYPEKVRLVKDTMYTGTLSIKIPLIGIVLSGWIVSYYKGKFRFMPPRKMYYNEKNEKLHYKYYHFPDRAMYQSFFEELKLVAREYLNERYVIDGKSMVRKEDGVRF